VIKRWLVIVVGCSTLFLSLTVKLQSGKAQVVPVNAPCQSYKIGMDTSGLPEIQGLSNTQTVWVLFFPYHFPVWSDEDLKIVWRMTGSGDFSLTAQHTDGTMIEPIWGPEAHSGSSWRRPGDEWGTAFRFPKAGCWRILVKRGADTGQVDLLVVPNQYTFF